MTQRIKERVSSGIGKTWAATRIPAMHRHVISMAIRKRLFLAAAVLKTLRSLLSFSFISAIFLFSKKPWQGFSIYTVVALLTIAYQALLYGTTLRDSYIENRKSPNDVA